MMLEDHSQILKTIYLITPEIMGNWAEIEEPIAIVTTAFLK